MQFKIREATDEDFNFIISTWLRSYRANGTGYKCKDDIYFEHHQSLIKKALESSKAFIACNPDDLDQIFGYIVADDNSLHFIYVKEVYRKFGVGTILVKLLPEKMECSHWTKDLGHLQKYRRFKYNPYYFYLSHHKEL